MAKGKTIPLLSPEKYIRTRARTLPFGLCYINAGWKESGMALIIVTRKHINKNITFAIFQVDLYCLGIKEAIYNFNADPDIIADFRKKHDEMSEHGDPVNEVDNYFLATVRLVKAAAYTMAITAYDWNAHHEDMTNALYVKVSNALTDYIINGKGAD